MNSESMTSLVAPEKSETMNLSAPIIAFSRDDFPTFGLPTKETFRDVSREVR
jgi:hypothetical protein